MAGSDYLPHFTSVKIETLKSLPKARDLTGTELGLKPRQLAAPWAHEPNHTEPLPPLAGTCTYVQVSLCARWEYRQAHLSVGADI